MQETKTTLATTDNDSQNKEYKAEITISDNNLDNLSEVTTLDATSKNRADIEQSFSKSKNETILTRNDKSGNNNVSADNNTGLVLSYSRVRNKTKDYEALNSELTDLTDATIGVIEAGLKAGFAFSAGTYNGKHRSIENNKGTNVIFVDIDDTQGLTPNQYINSNSFILRSALFATTTFSNKATNPRLCIAFQLPYVVKDPQEYKLWSKWLVTHMPGADKSCTDIGRIRFGNTKAEVIHINDETTTLPKEILEIATYEQEKNDENYRRLCKLAGKKFNNAKAIKSDFNLAANTLIPYIAEVAPRQVGKGISGNYEMWMHIIAACFHRFSGTEYEDGIIAVLEEHCPSVPKTTWNIENKFYSFKRSEGNLRKFPTIIYYYKQLGGSEKLLPNYKKNPKANVEEKEAKKQDVLTKEDYQKLINEHEKEKVKRVEVPKTKNKQPNPWGAFPDIKLKKEAEGYKEIEEQYLPKTRVQDGNAQLVISPTGTGKSTKAFNVCKSASKNGLVIYIVPTVALCLDIESKLKSLEVNAVHLNKLKNEYQGSDLDDYLKNYKGVVIACPESIHYFKSTQLNKGSCLVIDEVTTVINNIETSTGTMKNGEIRAFQHLRELINALRVDNFGGVLLMENTVNDSILKYLKELGIKKEKFEIIVNKYKPKNAPHLTHYENRLILINEISKHPYSFIACDGDTTTTGKIAKRLGENQTLLINRETKDKPLVQEFLRTPNKDIFFKNHTHIKFVIYSPTVSNGNDFNCSWKKVFGIFNHLPSSNIIQMLARCRNPENIHLWLNKNIGRKGSIENVFTTHQVETLLWKDLLENAGQIAKHITEQQRIKANESGNSWDDDTYTRKLTLLINEITTKENPSVNRHIKYKAELLTRQNQERYQRRYNVLQHYVEQGSDFSFNKNETTKEDKQVNKELTEAYLKEKSRHRAEIDTNHLTTAEAEAILNNPEASEDSRQAALKKLLGKNLGNLAPLLNDENMQYLYFVKDKGKYWYGLKNRALLFAGNAAKEMKMSAVNNDCLTEYLMTSTISPGKKSIKNLAQFELLKKIEPYLLDFIETIGTNSFNYKDESVIEFMEALLPFKDELYRLFSVKLQQDKQEDYLQYNLVLTSKGFLQDGYPVSLWDINSKNFPRTNPQDKKGFSKTVEQAVHGCFIRDLKKILGIIGYKVSEGKRDGKGERLRNYQLTNYKNVLDTILVRRLTEKILKKINPILVTYDADSDTAPHNHVKCRIDEQNKLLITPSSFTPVELDDTSTKLLNYHCSPMVDVWEHNPNYLPVGRTDLEQQLLTATTMDDYSALQEHHGYDVVMTAYDQLFPMADVRIHKSVFVLWNEGFRVV